MGLSTSPRGHLRPQSNTRKSVHHRLPYQYGARVWVQQLGYPRYYLHLVWSDASSLRIGPLVWPEGCDRDEDIERGHAMSVLQRHMGARGGRREAPANFGGVLPQLPGLMEFLTVDSYPDGEVRQRSTLLVFVEEGVVKVCLNDRAEERSLWRSAASMEDCLLELETALQSEGTDWRKSGKGKGKSVVKK